MAKQKVNVHREWFQSIVKSKCDCGLNRAKRITLGLDPQMYAHGNYHAARWFTVSHFCQGCFETRVIERLHQHAHGCGCTFELCARSGYSLPSWITLDTQECKVAS